MVHVVFLLMFVSFAFVSAFSPVPLVHQFLLFSQTIGPIGVFVFALVYRSADLHGTTLSRHSAEQ